MAGNLLDLDGLVELIFDNRVKRIINAGKINMDATLTRIVNEWYDGFNGAPMLATFIFEEPQVSISNFHASITFVARSESGRYNGVHDHGYGARHGFGDMREWVYDLQMYQGIIGLPAYASVWEAEHGEPYNRGSWSEGFNTHFHKKEPLYNSIISNSAWSRWENAMVNILTI